MEKNSTLEKNSSSNQTKASQKVSELTKKFILDYSKSVSAISVLNTKVLTNNN